MNNKFYIELGIWSAVVLGAFVIAWRAGWVARVAAYTSETQEELKKCNWPSREELWNSTVLVFVVLVGLGVFTVGADFFILKVVRSML